MRVRMVSGRRLHPRLRVATSWDQGQPRRTWRRWRHCEIVAGLCRFSSPPSIPSSPPGSVASPSSPTRTAVVGRLSSRHSFARFRCGGPNNHLSHSNLLLPHPATRMTTIFTHSPMAAIDFHFSASMILKNDAPHPATSRFSLPLTIASLFLESRRLCVSRLSISSVIILSSN